MTKTVTGRLISKAVQLCQPINTQVATTRCGSDNTPFLRRTTHTLHQILKNTSILLRFFHSALRGSTSYSGSRDFLSLQLQSVKSLRSPRVRATSQQSLFAGRRQLCGFCDYTTNCSPDDTSRIPDNTSCIPDHTSQIPDNTSCNPDDAMAEARFAADYSKRVSNCKKCKSKIEKGELRMAKIVPNFFHDGDGEMKQYHHPRCIFETFIKARSTTKIIEEADNIEGFTDLQQDDKDMLNQLIKETLEKKGTPKKAAPKKPRATPKKSPAAATSTTPFTPSPKPTPPAPPRQPTPLRQPTPIPDDLPGTSASSDLSEKDNSFRQFRRLCAEVADEASYTGKTKLIRTYMRKGSSGDGFRGDVYLLMKLLLPGVVKTVYNLNNKQLVKVFSQVFGTDLEEMVEDLEQGDVAETVRQFFEKSSICPPQKKSTLSLQHIDAMLTELSQYTKEDDQMRQLKKLAKRSTANDLKMIVRLIKHDLRINSGAKHILDALDPNAYMAFKASRNLRDVVSRVNELADVDGKPGMRKELSIKAILMTPVQPMLAEACKSVDQAFKKCPNGMYSEIKYDGERVQVHKQGDQFHFFSRSLKPVQNHKVQHFKEFIPLAFPHGNDLILDSEVLLIDTETSKPLPFGTLGIHKKQAFHDAQVGLFIFDCLHYNGESLMNKPIKERRKIMRENMTEIPNRILFSEMKHITERRQLKEMLMKVFREGLEGLVLKDVMGEYEPGKRHWLKVKKDYLAEGAMADTADLVVLGAYFGTGNKGGLMSIFLMGVYDPHTDKWCTVTKCGSGFDDKTLDKLQKDFNMVKISKDHSRVPSWLKITKNLTPDFVIADPKRSQVWEITGAEFSKSEAHTAGGVSIRFPRCTKMREDKSWKEATDLPRLLELYHISKQHSDIPDVIGASASKTPTKSIKAEDSDSCSSRMEVTDTESNGTASPSKSPIKRKISVKNGSSSPAVKKLKSEEEEEASKPMCKYGPGCYQKNQDHRANFSHSPKKTSKHLPDVFTGMKFYVPEEIHKYEQLKRYIIAFDGDLVPEYEKDAATHIIVQNQSDSGSSKHVPVEWLWRCIKKKALVPMG